MPAELVAATSSGPEVRALQRLVCRAPGTGGPPHMALRPSRRTDSGTRTLTTTDDVASPIPPARSAYRCLSRLGGFCLSPLRQHRRESGWLGGGESPTPDAVRAYRRWRTRRWRRPSAYGTSPAASLSFVASNNVCRSPSSPSSRCRLARRTLSGTRGATVSRSPTSRELCCPSDAGLIRRP